MKLRGVSRVNLLNIEHIHKVFGEKVIFDDVSFGVHEGDKIGIIGINGTGKSTLLKIIAGVQEADGGQIVKQNGLRIAYLAQNPDFPEDATVSSYALDQAGASDWVVQSNLTKLGISDFEARMDTLSGGQRRKVAMAKVLAADFDVLLLDEPTNHLDVDAKDSLKKALQEYRGSILLICHEPEFYQDVVNEVWDMSKWTTKVF